MTPRSTSRPVRVVPLLLRRILWRHWCRAPKSTAALVLTLALGVGVFFSVRLANQAAVAGFELFTANLTGESDLVLASPAGWLPEAILPELREITDPLPAFFFPVVEGTATVPATGRRGDGFLGQQLQVVGLDVPTLANLIYLADEQYEPPQRTGVTNNPALPRAYAAQSAAERNGWAVGEPVELIWNTEPLEVLLAGTLPAGNFRVSPPDNLLLMDLTDVWRLGGRDGFLSRVEVRLPPGENRDAWLNQVRTRLEAASNGRWLMETPDSLRASGATMTRAFRLNLTVLSGLALLVGLYLITQALEAAVVRRRQEIGVLRSLGIEAGAIRAAWLSEALLLGVIGGVLGLLLGFGGAQLAVRGIAQTVNSLYYSNTVSAAAWNWPEASLAFGVGCLTSLIAGWLPARDAAETPPARVLQRGYRGGGLRWLENTTAGWLLIAAGVAAWFVPPLEWSGAVRFPLAGYLAAIAWVLGAGILGGRALGWIGVVGARAANERPLLRFAASQLKRPTGRHRLAVAGLIVAFGMAAGMSILIASFERTMETWINRSLRADLFVAPQGVGNISNANRIEPPVWRALVNDPAVGRAEIGQMYPVRFDGGTTYLVGAGAGQGEPPGWRDLIWLQRPTTPDLAPTAAFVPAWVNESFVNRFQRRVGDVVEAPTPAGIQALRVTGVFADYGNERGAIVIDREQLAAWFQDDRALNVAVYLKPGIDSDVVRDRWLAEHPGLVVRPNARLREEVWRIFNQTFAVTHALQWIGIVVAVGGVALALISLAIERKREFATLQELGLTRRQVARTVALEAVLLSGAGIVVGTVLSVALGALLIYVINKQSFGWTLAFVVPPFQLVLAAVAVLIVGAITAWRIGHWAATLPSDREE